MKTLIACLLFGMMLSSAWAISFSKQLTGSGIYTQTTVDQYGANVQLLCNETIFQAITLSKEAPIQTTPSSITCNEETLPDGLKLIYTPATVNTQGGVFLSSGNISEMIATWPLSSIDYIKPLSLK